MIVVANGGYRTGSTFAYNAARLLCGPDFKTAVLSQHDIEALDPVENWVVKSHNWLPPVGSTIKTVYTRRHFLDTYASFVKIKTMNLDPVAEILVEKYRERVMLARPALTLEYRDFFGNEIFAVEKIAQYLQIDGDMSGIAQQLVRARVRHEIETGRVIDAQNYHQNHISSDGSPGNFIDVLSAVDIENTVRVYRAHNV